MGGAAGDSAPVASVSVMPLNGAAASNVTVASVGRVLSYRVGPGGEVVVRYELLSLDVQEVALRMSVCGLKLEPASGWLANRPQSSFSGTHVLTLHVEPEARTWSGLGCQR